MNMSVLRQVLETSVASLKENQVLFRATSLAMLQLCNIARNILREVVFCNLSHSGTRKMIYHINRFSLSWAFCTCNLFSGLFCLVVYYNQTTNQNNQSSWDTVTYFGLNGLSMILCLWSTLHSLSLLRAIQDHAQNVEEQLWMEGRREVSITVSHRPVTITDLKQERSFFRQTVSIFYNWLKLLVEKSIIKSWRHGRRTRIPYEKKRPNTMRVLYLLSSWDPLGVL